MGNFKYFIVSLVILGYLSSGVESLTCHGCNSNVALNCASQPIQVSEQMICEVAGDTCVVAILTDGSTYRGCSSDIPVASVSQSESCNADLCNAQIYPADRLQCFQCEKEDCLTVTAGSELPCVVYSANDKCFTDVIDEIDVVRGCASDMGYVNGIYTKECTTSGCNNQPASTKFSCLKCDSEVDNFCVSSEATGPTCFVTPRDNCEYDVLLGRNEECFTYRKDERVVRGCSRDGAEYLVQNNFVKECIFPDCNDECIEPPTCYMCDSTEDPNCVDDLKDLTAEICPLHTLSCHTCRDGENIARGCGKTEESGECQQCWDDPGCNNKKMLECYSCTSETDPNCDKWTNPDNIDKVLCNGNCIASHRNGYVVRGCQSNSFDCVTSVTCQTCTEDRCNDSPMPKQRLRCHQCDPSDPTCNGAQDENMAEYCPILVDDDDKCYLYINSDNEMVRGCTTDESYAKCEELGARCVTCSGDGCNSEPLYRKLTCLECDSNIDSDCTTGSNPGSECAVTTEKTCEVEVLFGEFDYCYTHRVGEQVRRGCSKNDELSLEFENVRECNQDKCNDECIPATECFVCDSTSDPKCVDDTSSLSSEVCSNGEISCHSCRDEDGMIVRGCGKSDGSSECSSCWEDPGCNDRKMLECYSCSSENDPNCDLLTNPELIEKKICNGNCIATLHGSNVVRGCQSKSLDCKPGFTCQSCTEDNCNVGSIPEKKRRCHQCDGSNPTCDDAQEESSATFCAITEDEDDTCYEYLNRDSKMVRGCTTDPSYLECELFSVGACLTCHGDGCNSHPRNGKQTCLECDSNEDQNCVTGPTPGTECALTEVSTCDVDRIFGQYEYCFTYRSGEHVRRGCSKNDIEYSSQFKKVRECRYDHCNDECIDETECYVCDSVTDPNCIDDPNNLNAVCTDGEISCHTCRNTDGKIVRGCGSADNAGECESCWNDPLCNNKRMLQCYSCNSELDPNCDLWTNPDDIDKVICNGDCIATIRDGHVIRGCQTSSFDCPISETCNKCSKDNCNEGKIPASTFRCHQCDSSDPSCNNEQDPSLATNCPSSENPEDEEKCYLYLNDENKMVRGCVTDDSYRQCEELELGRCATCSGSGCNSDAAVRSMTCLVCDSKTDPSCKSSGNAGPDCEVTASDSCAVDVLFGQNEYCYTYRLGEHVRRGCSKEEPTYSEDFKNVRECRLDNCNNECIDATECYVCDSTANPNCIDDVFSLSTAVCSDGAVSCHTCRDQDSKIIRGCGDVENAGECAACWDEPGCNNKKMLECYSCTSETDPNCNLWTDPSKIDKEICNGNCIATVRDGHVIRGCQRINFDCQTSPTCKTCTEDNCNDGRIPEIEFLCHRCGPNDPGCDNEQDESSLQSCPLSENEDEEKCYLYLNDENKMVRGCVTDDSYRQCEELELGRCATCSGSGCNSDAAVRSMTCLVCDSKTDPFCKSSGNAGPDCEVTASDSCAVDVLFGQNEYCYTYRLGEHVRRGCSKEEPAYSEDFKNVRECRLDNCNNECIDATECYVCDSTVNPNCIDDVFSLSTDVCSDGAVSCHTCRDQDKKVIRGCGEVENAGECAACWDEPGCNNKKMLECYSCTSETDPNCDLWTDPSKIDKEICNGNCIATVRDGHVIRGCQRINFDCQTSPTCKTCTEDNCNDGRIPEIEFLCHRCGPNDPGCDNEQDESSLQSCPLSENEDEEKCYLYLNDENKMVRGCVTDDSYRQCEELELGRCATCSGSGCNSDAAVRSMTCLVCDSKTDPSCKSSGNAGPDCEVTASDSCAVDVLFGQNEYCYTYRLGEHVRRGCSKEEPAYSEDFKNVRECRLDNCNNECIDATECYVCDSTANPNCIDDIFSLSTDVCSDGAVSCHTCRDQDKKVIRGCGEVENAGECAACWDEPGCNNKKMLECYSCTSETDPNCDLWTDPSKIDKEICNGNCIATVRDGYVIRGCQRINFDCQASPTCKSCTADNCNAGRIPEIEFRCHQCGPNDPGCDNEQDESSVQSCPLSENEDEEKCYLYLNDANKMVRGCASDESYKECQELELGRCVTCSGSGCNSDASVRKMTCLVCDSKTDPSCKNGVHLGAGCEVVASDSCEVDVIFGQSENCYTYQVGEHVRRGCSKLEPAYVEDFRNVRECRLNNCNNECVEATECYVCNSAVNPNCIDDVFSLSIEECNDGSVSCHTCRDQDRKVIRGCGEVENAGECAACWDDPGCNNKKMLECYSCTSETDPNCDLWTDPSKIDKEICNGNCIATLRDGFVIRGCQRINFDCQASPTCKTCTEDNCNDGRIPENGVRCHQCGPNDPDCNNLQDISSARSCPVSEVPGQEVNCYLYLDSESNMHRGCTSDAGYNDCEASSGTQGCAVCSGNGCNSNPVRDTLTCVACNSTVDEGCITNSNPGTECSVVSPKYCNVSVLFGEYEYCYTYHVGEEVHRGCSKDAPSLVAQQEYVRECRLNNCNDECFEAEQCYACDSRTNPSCIENTSSLSIQQCSTEISCYSCRNSEKVIRRGCGAGETFGQCSSCWGDPGCNNKKKVECYSCNSQVDQNCADWTDPGRINKMICDGNCIATIRDGFVIRGCQRNDFDCPISDTCNRCNEDECNSGLIPANRISCHQCNETDANCNAVQASSPTVCSSFDNDGQCFLFMNSNGKMIRGCTTDDRYVECKASAEGRCLTCAGSGCNSAGAMKAPTLSCAKCTGGGACPWWQTNASKCEKELPYYEKETCFTLMNSEESVTRGCTADGSVCDSTSTICQTCSTDNCNNGNRLWQSCLQCTGSGNEDCVEGDKIDVKICSKVDQLFESRGCFAKRDGDKVTRGCLYEMTADEQKKCENDDKTCEICLPQGCNKKNLKSNATGLSAFSTLLLIFVAYLLQSSF